MPTDTHNLRYCRYLVATYHLTQVDATVWQGNSRLISPCPSSVVYHPSTYLPTCYCLSWTSSEVWPPYIYLHQSEDGYDPGNGLWIRPASQRHIAHPKTVQPAYHTCRPSRRRFRGNSRQVITWLTDWVSGSSSGFGDRYTHEGNHKLLKRIIMTEHVTSWL